MDTENKVSRRNEREQAVINGAEASSDSSSLTSCDEGGSKRIVFYFTGIGNSLYVAKLLSGEPLSIAQVMKEKELTFEADEIGFVFPDYRAMAPEMVKRFVRRATFKAPYIFAVITYGHFECNVVDRWMRFAAQYGLRFDYIATLLMVDNYLPVFDMEEERRIDKRTEERLMRIIKELSAHKLHIPFLSDEELAKRQAILEQFPELFPVRSEELIEVTDRCVECALCTRVCPRGNFKLSGRAQNEGDCEYCLACAHACPEKAIVMKGGEKNREARYRHPAVSMEEIIEANEQ